MGAGAGGPPGIGAVPAVPSSGADSCGGGGYCGIASRSASTSCESEPMRTLVSSTRFADDAQVAGDLIDVELLIGERLARVVPV